MITPVQQQESRTTYACIGALEEIQVVGRAVGIRVIGMVAINADRALRVGGRVGVAVVSDLATTSPRLARTQTGREPRLGAARDADGRARTGAHVRDRDAVSMVTLEDERDAGVSGERRLSVA